jgi:hypothetical protein
MTIKIAAGKKLHIIDCETGEVYARFENGNAPVTFTILNVETIRYTETKITVYIHEYEK